MEGRSLKERNIRDQNANELPNGFGFGVDLVNSMNKIECTGLQYKRRHLTMLSSYVQGC